MEKFYPNFQSKTDYQLTRDILDYFLENNMIIGYYNETKVKYMEFVKKVLSWTNRQLKLLVCLYTNGSLGFLFYTRN